MHDVAKRFVADWAHKYISTIRYHEYSAELIEDLARKLEEDAWECGLSRRHFLDAVNGGSYKFVSLEVDKALERTSARRQRTRRPDSFPSLVPAN